MNAMNGSSLLLNILKDEGVSYLFGNPGTTELPIMHALNDHPDLKYVLGLQEAIVVAMADGFSRSSGGLTACNLHVAPGLGNAMGSIFNAKWSRSPMIISAGQQEQGHGLMEPMLYGDLVRMASPWVKWAFEVSRVNDLPRILRRAAKIARTPPTGPVFLSLPGDILNSEVSVSMSEATHVQTNTVPDKDTLRDIGNHLLNSQMPLLICGEEVARGDVLEEVAELAGIAGAAAMQQSVVSGAHYFSEHPTFMGALTRVQQQVRNELSQYDLIVVLGGDVFRMSVAGSVEAVPEHTKIIHISQLDWEMGKNFPAQLAVRAELKPTLVALLEYLRTNRSELQASAAADRIEGLKANNWSAKRKAARELILSRDDGDKIDADRAMLEIVDGLPEGAIVVDEGLVSSRQLPQLYPFRSSRDFYGLDSGGIGFAIAGSIGISLANPGRPVIAIIGDGSAMYGIQALWTAAKHQLPIIYVICNNSSYRILKERLLAGFDSESFIGMDLRNPVIDFTAMAQSLGVWAERVETVDSLSEVFRTACQLDGPKLIEVSIADGF